VLPESIDIGGGEGPSVVGSMLTALMTFISLLGMLGVPRSQAPAVGPGVGVGPSLSFPFPLGLVTKMALYPGGLVIRILPPMTLVRVAFLLCPVAGYLHVALVWLQMLCDQQYVPHGTGVGLVGGWMPLLRMPVLAVRVPFIVEHTKTRTVESVIMPASYARKAARTRGKSPTQKGKFKHWQTQVSPTANQRKWKRPSAYQAAQQ
jgi:hypothetical protein